MRKESLNLLLNKYYFEPDLKCALDKSFRHSNNLMVIDDLIEKESKDLAYILEMDNYTLELLFSQTFKQPFLKKIRLLDYWVNIHQSNNPTIHINENSLIIKSVRRVLRG